MTSTDPATMLSTPGSSLVPRELLTEGATALAAAPSRGVSHVIKAMFDRFC